VCNCYCVREASSGKPAVHFVTFIIEVYNEEQAISLYNCQCVGRFQVTMQQYSLSHL